MNEKKDDIVEGKMPKNHEIDDFWKSYHKETVKNTLSILDERAKFMITTCAVLIVANSGLLSITEKLNVIFSIPQILLVVSMTCFVLSYFSKTKKISFDTPDEIKDAYTSWAIWKRNWQYAAFIFFIIGITLLIILSFYS